MRAEESAGSPQVLPLAFDYDEADPAVVLREVLTSGGGTVDLAEARVVVAAGRGVRDDQGKAFVQELADLFDGAIGASRAVVESGLFSATAQIGQTGKVVAPELYFAVGISGAIQHVAGMANSRVIVAINKDRDAPIFQYATYGLVGDLYKILPNLINELRAAKAAGLMDERFDCIVVGGGIAGLSAAMVLARAGKRFLLIERGEFCGSKNVSGGVLWGTDLERLVPAYWEEDGGFERFVNHRRLSFMDPGSLLVCGLQSPTILTNRRTWA